MAGTKGDILLLEHSLARLRALRNVDDDACGVPVAAKAEVRPYIDSWVEPLVEAVLLHLRDGEPIPQYLVEAARQDHGRISERVEGVAAHA